MSTEQTGGCVQCQGTLGSKPWWMSWGQYDPCRCKLPAGHIGKHECEHTDSSLGPWAAQLGRTP